MPERVQEQLVPQRKGQPAGTPLSRPLQSQSAEPDLDDVAVQFRSLAIFRKDGYLLWGRRALINHVNRSTPGGPLAIVNLAKIQHLALYNAIPLAPPILDDAPSNGGPCRPCGGSWIAETCPQCVNLRRQVKGQGRHLLAAHKLSGLVAHDLSGFDWVPKEVPNETNRVVTGDPTDEV